MLLQEVFFSVPCSWLWILALMWPFNGLAHLLPAPLMAVVGLVLHYYAGFAQCVVGQVPPEPAKKKIKQLGLVERGWDSFLYGWSLDWAITGNFKPICRVSDLHPFWHSKRKLKLDFFFNWIFCLMASSALHLNTLCSGKSFILEILTSNFRSITSVYRCGKYIFLHQKYPRPPQKSTTCKLLGDSF